MANTKSTNTKKTNKISFKHKIKRFLKIAYVRLYLLWLWFLKNIGSLVTLTFIILIILTVCGVPIFGSDIRSMWINAFTGFSEDDIPDNVETIASAVSYSVGSAVSASAAVVYLLKKGNSITVDDVKSRKVKIAMIEANVYFDDEGKLKKKLEVATGLDINGDGTVEADDDTNTWDKMINMIKGLFTVSTAKIKEDTDLSAITTPLKDETTQKKISWLRKARNRFCKLWVDLYANIKETIKYSKLPKVKSSSKKASAATSNLKTVSITSSTATVVVNPSTASSTSSPTALTSTSSVETTKEKKKTSAAKSKKNVSTSSAVATSTATSKEEQIKNLLSDLSDSLK